MFYSRKRQVGDFPSEMTAIWSCTKESCNGWMRAGYSFAAVPTCPQCRSTMVESAKSLPILVDSGYDLKKTMKKMEAAAE
jgi:hypothetical protein